MKLLSSKILGLLLGLLLWLSFCVMAGTGILLAWRLPAGSCGVAALGLKRCEWIEWHTWTGVAFGVFILVHLLLHWQWIWKVAARRTSWRLLLGVGIGLALLAGIAWAPLSRSPRGHDRKINARIGQ